MTAYGFVHHQRIAARARSLRSLGALGQLGGAALIATGIAAWTVVSRELAREHIVVSGDARLLPGKPVRGPISAYAEAEVIQAHALKASGGKSYAELGMDDPVRATVMNGSFLRASLFTSVLAFGVSAFAVGAGVLFAAFGIAVRRAAR